MGDEVSADDLVGDTSVNAPHVVILGAGASRAAFPDGERNGKRLPLMNDFTEIVPIQDTLEDAGVSIDGNFEEIYSKISEDESLISERKQLENQVFDYFDSMRLPDSVTMYDRLLLSLRSTDVVATFNWDPFLVDAARRYPSLKDQMPRLLFLHGNVRIGFCAECNVTGLREWDCPECGQALTPSKLLYPVLQKDYRSNPRLSADWDILQSALDGAVMVTVFGYGAPSSDENAVKLMKSGWGESENRRFAEIEVIEHPDKDEREVRSDWDDFIHSHHYQVHGDFGESWIAKYPRRTTEAWYEQNLMAKFVEPFPMPGGAGRQELVDWLEPFLEAERHE